MQIIIFVLLSTAIAMGVYFTAPLFIHHMLIDKIMPNINIKNIEMRIVTLESMNETLQKELTLTGDELSKSKKEVQNLLQENAQLKSDLAKQMEKDKKNISKLFN